MKTSAELLQRQVGANNEIAAEMAGYIATAIAFIYGLRGQVQRIGDRMDGFVERMAAVET